MSLQRAVCPLGRGRQPWGARNLTSDVPVGLETDENVACSWPMSQGGSLTRPRVAPPISWERLAPLPMASARRPVQGASCCLSAVCTCPRPMAYLIRPMAYLWPYESTISPRRQDDAGFRTAVANLWDLTPHMVCEPLVGDRWFRTHPCSQMLTSSLTCSETLDKLLNLSDFLFFNKTSGE